MKNARHQVNVLRPTEAQGTRGQTQGQPSVIYRSVPCSIKTLSGREVVQARTVFAEADHEVELYGDPKKRILAKDFLEFGGRRLDIGFANDVQQNGVHWILLCHERQAT